MKGTILLHESDSELRKVIALHLEGSDWRVLQSKTTAFAKQLLDREDPEILISDYVPHDPSYEALFNCFREEDRESADSIPWDSILILTTLDRLGEAALERIKPELVIHKPYDVRLMERKIDRLIAARQEG